MTTALLTQDSLIEALRELRAAHPDLPGVDWHIGQYSQELRGDATASQTREVFAAYAAALGGDIVPRHTFSTPSLTGGTPELRQAYLLEGVWADVRFVITGSVPVSELAGAA